MGTMRVQRTQNKKAKTKNKTGSMGGIKKIILLTDGIGWTNGLIMNREMDMDMGITDIQKYSFDWFGLDRI